MDTHGDPSPSIVALAASSTAAVASAEPQEDGKYVSPMKNMATASARNEETRST